MCGHRVRAQLLQGYEQQREAEYLRSPYAVRKLQGVRAQRFDEQECEPLQAEIASHQCPVRRVPACHPQESTEAQERRQRIIELRGIAALATVPPC